MIEKVEAWQGAPEGLKEFALSQLRESRDFDCREPFKYYGKRPDTDPFNWINDKLSQTRKELLRAEQSYAEEVERVEGRNEWLKQLRESLDSPAVGSLDDGVPNQFDPNKRGFTP